MKTHLLILLAFTTGYCALTASLANNNTELELRGVCYFQNQWQFSIFNKKTTSSQWIYLNKKFHDILITDYDVDSSIATLSYKGKVLNLKIAKSNDTPIVVLNSAIHTQSVIADINQKVDEFRQGLSQILGTPDTGPRNNKEQQKLEQDVENAVADYRQQLMAATDKNQIPLGNISNDPRYHVTGVRRYNRVNSRIWASDHIEKYGIPDERRELIIDAPSND
jgi:hypothetical protein